MGIVASLANILSSNIVFVALFVLSIFITLGLLLVQVAIPVTEKNYNASKIVSIITAIVLPLIIAAQYGLISVILIDSYSALFINVLFIIAYLGHILVSVLAIALPFTFWLPKKNTYQNTYQTNPDLLEIAQNRNQQIISAEQLLKQQAQAHELLAMGAITQEEYKAHFEQKFDQAKNNPSNSIENKIKHLKTLKQNGVITEDEYKDLLKTLL